MKDEWETVIGLEIHAQLNTKSKIFSPAANHFGDEPNTNITSICTGQPGVLPVLNKEVVKKAVQFGLATDAIISEISTFDRKSYFYPDCPKNFQITQFYHPIIRGGRVIAEVNGAEKEFFIEQVHMEEDAGSLKHFSKFGGVDFNRSGAPLIEIVSKPCMHSPEEAVSYAMAIRSILLYLDASDCNMEEGSLRFDGNVSVRKKGETSLRPKTEIKNLNSFHFLQLALTGEIKRQIALYEKNPEIKPAELIQQGTYRWDAEKKKIVMMRSKELAADYRYCPEPDLPPLIIKKEQIEKIKSLLPELPRQKVHRFCDKFNLSKDTAHQLIQSKKIAFYYEEAAATCKNKKILANWILVEFMGKLNELKTTFFALGIKAENISSLVNLIEDKTITTRMAKEIADIMIQNPTKTPQTIVEENPQFTPVSDLSTIEPIIDKTLENFPESVQDYRQGRTKAFAFLVGQVMKETKGQASPQIVSDLIHKKLDSKQ